MSFSEKIFKQMTKIIEVNRIVEGRNRLMKRWSSLLACALLLAFALLRLAYGDCRGFAVSNELNGLYPGNDSTAWLTSTINTSTGLDALNLDFTSTGTTTEYELFAREISFRDSFLLSKDEVNGNEERWYEYVINPRARTPAELGRRGDGIDFGNLAPHAGIDWDHEIGEGNEWVVSLDLGIAFQGLMKLEPDSDGSATTNPSVSAHSRGEKQGLTDKIKNAATFFGFALTYKF
jgi:hypothetical protein